MKPNQDRIDFLLIRDIDAILNIYFDKFGAADDDVLWAMEAAYRKGIDRGLQMAREVDTLIEGGDDEDPREAAS